MRNAIETLGPTRVALYLFTLLLLPFVWIADPSADVGWRATAADVAPALAVLLFFVLLLDALMNKIFAIDARQEASDNAASTTRFRIRLRASLLGAALILLFWGPYFNALLA